MAGVAACLIFSGLSCATAQAGASFNAATRMFRLDGGAVTYAFGVTDADLLQTAYWGPRLAAADTLEARAPRRVASIDPTSSVSPQEYPSWGGGLYSEPALKVAFADGARDLTLHYVSGRVDGGGVIVELADATRPLKVTLRYTIDEQTGIVGRSATILNAGRDPVRVDQASSAAWSLPVGEDYRLYSLTGRWAAEWTLDSRPLTGGATVLESRRGSTSNHANPWFAIDRSDASTEEAGPVWFGALAWSGSWRISVERNPVGDVRVVGGMNPFDFAYRLKPGERLETPVFYAGFSARGMGGASRLLHQFQIDKVLPNHPAPRLRPVLYNSWEATEFAVDEQSQMALADKAAKIGVERFVIDDGWFGARNNNKAGLGDWTVNPTKFPNGLKPLIDKVHGLGMEFGLWVEPEMVNPDSDLYRAHPDWVIAMKDRPRTEQRNQLVLNLARKDVRDHVLKTIDDLVTQNDIQFLKWDHNRNWSEPGWPGVDPAEEQRLYVDYVHNLYGIIAELRRRHPHLEIESCAGGGGRVDLGILALTDQVWPSDNTDPYDRLSMQDGFTHAYSPGVMMAWVTDSPSWVNSRATSLDYRFLSAMQGGLGVGANLNHWSDADFAGAARMIAAYKQIRQTIQRGELYRLIRPTESSPRSATFYVSQDRRQAVLFAFVHSSAKNNVLSNIRAAGLDPARRYRMRPIDVAASADQPVQSGAFWMGQGVELPMKGDFQATARVLEAVD